MRLQRAHVVANEAARPGFPFAKEGKSSRRREARRTG
jgi:hypothetical protein